MAENDPSENPAGDDAREEQRKADYVRLVSMKRSAEEARAGALEGDYYAGAWEEWRALAEEYQAALTGHVKTYGMANRFELEQEVLRAAKEPEGTAAETAQ